MTALRDFFDDKIEIFDGQRWSYFDEAQRLRFMRQPFPCFELDYVSDERKLVQLYNRLNFGGVAHREDQRAQAVMARLMQDAPEGSGTPGTSGAVGAAHPGPEAPAAPTAGTRPFTVLYSGADGATGAIHVHAGHEQGTQGPFQAAALALHEQGIGPAGAIALLSALPGHLTIDTAGVEFPGEPGQVLWLSDAKDILGLDDGLEDAASGSHPTPSN